MGRFSSIGLIALPLAAVCSAAAPAGIVRVGPPTAAIMQSVAVPVGAEMVFVSGTVPDAVVPATTGAPADYGDTETQVRSILGKIEGALKAQGFAPGDVVMMHVYLLAPPGAKAMDFAGMMRAYSQHYGTAAQPVKPARTTVQVAGLAAPGFLAEIDVVAARPAKARK